MYLQPVSWDGYATFNDGLNFESYFPRDAAPNLPLPVRSNYVDRPYFEPVYTNATRQVGRFKLVIKRLGTLGAQLDQIKMRFYPGDQNRKKLIVRDADDNDRQWYCYCKVTDIPEVSGQEVTITLERTTEWFAQTSSSLSWAITATGQQLKVTPGGNIPARPVITITPTADKTTFDPASYRRSVVVYNQTDRTFANYPYELSNGGLNTSALVGAGKMQSSCNDLRIRVDGVEVPRWLYGANSTATKIWLSLNLSQRAELVLSGNIAGAGTLTQIAFQNTTGAQAALQRMPSAGRVLIDSEVFYYTAKTDSDPNNLKVTGITRAVMDTSMGSHTTGATVRWIEHDIVITYGDSSLPAPTQDDTNKPIFDLSTSSNTLWVYSQFMELYKGRGGGWTPYASMSNSWSSPYRDETVAHNETSNVQPGPSIAEAIGLGWVNYYYSASGTMTWTLYCPAGIAAFNATGYKAMYWNAGGSASATTPAIVWPGTAIQKGTDASAFSSVYSISAPAALNADTAFTSGPLIFGSNYPYVRLIQSGTTPANTGPTPALGHQNVAIYSATLTPDSAGVPVPVMQAETGVGVGVGYHLRGKITNTLTGEWLLLDFVMDKNQSLRIDCDAQTVTYLKDGSVAQSALSVFSSVRFDWLNLTPQTENSLQYDETGITGTTVTVSWQDRSA